MPGSGKQSADVQRQIIEFLEAGIDPTTIHRRLKVGRSSIYRMKRCLQQHGTAYAPPETNKKNGRPRVMTSEQEQEIRAWLQDPANRERYLDDMVWFIHERFGMVCSTTTCSKIKRKWLKVIEAEERGERLDPADAQEQVRQESFRVAKRTTNASKRQQQQQQQQMQQMQQLQTQQAVPPTTDAGDLHMSADLELAMLQQENQPQPLPEYRPEIDQSLQDYKPEIDQHLQEQLQTEVAHAALRQSGLG